MNCFAVDVELHLGFWMNVSSMPNGSLVLIMPTIAK